jgi:hypothetical protein
MKISSLLFLLVFALVACDKSDNDEAPVDNGPIGGTYKFTGSTTNLFDTSTGPGIMTTNEYTTTTSNHQGTITITAHNISSKGLMFNSSTAHTRKETNTSTGAVVTSNSGPFTGTSGSATDTYNSNYTIDVAAGQLTIDNAQYLFNPSFINQPLDKKHSYTLTGNTLQVTTNTYSASSRSRTVNVAIFTKQ